MPVQIGLSNGEKWVVEGDLDATVNAMSGPAICTQLKATAGGGSTSSATRSPTSLRKRRGTCRPQRSRGGTARRTAARPLHNVMVADGLLDASAQLRARHRQSLDRTLHRPGTGLRSSGRRKNREG